MSKDLKGFKHYRVDQTDVFGIFLSVTERWMVHQFNEEFGPKDLEHIISHPRGHLTEDEKRVAMTMIQWMGTNVGRGFVEQVFYKADKQIAVLSEMRSRLTKTHNRKIRENTITPRFNAEMEKRVMAESALNVPKPQKKTLTIIKDTPDATTDTEL